MSTKLLAAALCLTVAHWAAATPITIVDTTPGTAVNNGSLGVGEYAGYSTGINGGFGDVLGANSRIYLDSSLGGALNIGVQSGGGNLNDFGVIYIDSVSGGFGSLFSLADTADSHRQAISGWNGSNYADINFAPGFEADYAIAFNNGFAGVWQLAAGGNDSLIYLGDVNINPVSTPGAGFWEMNLTLSQIGVNPGDSFKYIVTYLNPSSMFRSDEFHGVAALGGGNPGSNTTVTLASGDYNVFQTVPEPTSGLLLVGGLGLLAALRRKLAA